MKIIDYFEKAQGNTLVSFEVLPPLEGGSMTDIFKTMDRLVEFKPPFIDVSYHREEYVSTRGKVVIMKKRPFAKDLVQ